MTETEKAKDALFNNWNCPTPGCDGSGNTRNGQDDGRHFMTHTSSKYCPNAQQANQVTATSSISKVYSAMNT